MNLAGEESPALAQVLDSLAGLVDPLDLPQVDELQRRFREQRFRVLVVGEAKRGKSTLINALLGRDVLPAGAVPVTAVTTTVTFGRPERVAVDYTGGRADEQPLPGLGALVTEDGNPGNQRGVERVTVFLNAPLLQGGLELVDTPGAGSVRGHDTETGRALAAMDAAVFVLTADPPVSASERNLLLSVAAASVRTFVVLNKVDRLDRAELQQVQNFVALVVSAALEQEVKIYPCSARSAVQARLVGGDAAGTGLDEFEADFLRYLQAGRADELERSLSGRARRMTLHTLDGVRLQLRLQAMQTDEEAARVGQFQQRLNRLSVQRRDATDLVAAGTAHLLDDLNRAATAAEQTLTRQVVQLTRQHLSVRLAGVPVASLRSEGRAFVADLARDTVDAWRSTRQAALESGLLELERRLLTALAEELGELRQAAHEIFDVDLLAEDDRSRLVDEPDFSYQLNENVRWNDPLTDALRRLPGAAARRRAVNHLLAEASRLTSQQVGRVRADFQYRLQESGRVMAEEVNHRYIASTATIEQVLNDAARTQGRTAVETEQMTAGLLDREDGLMRMLDNLGHLARPPRSRGLRCGSDT